MTTTKPVTTRSRRREESGSILVEMTLVVPILMLLVAGMIEVGAAWRDKSTVIQASRQGARVNSNLALNAEADLQALQAVAAVLPSNGLSRDVTLVAVAIYDADSLTPAQIANCQAGATTLNGCNYYDATKLADLVQSNFDGTNANWDNRWDPDPAISPSERDNSAASADSVGVYVEAVRPMLTNIFPGQTSQTITGFTVMRLEPVRGG